MVYLALCVCSLLLVPPDEDDDDYDPYADLFWQKFWLYQAKRSIMEMEGSMPHPKAAQSIITMLNSPMASLSIIKSLFYVLYGGLVNGDYKKTYKKGKHKGENVYWHNVKKYLLPFYKHIEELENLATSDAIFKTFEDKAY